MKVFKIVDTFNGWEDTARYNTLPEAQAAMEKLRKVFFRYPSNRNSKFHKEIVPATLEWEWDTRRNERIWK